jgi:multiple sugar transport system permease protein
MGAMMGKAMQTRAAKRWIDWAIIATMAVLAIGMLLPFLWLFSMSFRPVSDAYKLPPSFLPPGFDLSNYWEVLNSHVPFLRIYMNSVLIALVVTVIGTAPT